MNSLLPDFISRKRYQLLTIMSVNSNNSRLRNFRKESVVDSAKKQGM